jgi:hypothetical protein
MEFMRFAQFLKQRDEKMAENVTANKEAMAFDTKIQAFRNRFPDGDGERIVKLAGYPDVRAFLHDPDEAKWAKLKIPGQDNYVKNHPHHRNSLI